MEKRLLAAVAAIEGIPAGSFGLAVDADGELVLSGPDFAHHAGRNVTELRRADNEDILGADVAQLVETECEVIYFSEGRGGLRLDRFALALILDYEVHV